MRPLQFNTVQSGFFLALIVLLGVVALYLIRPFFFPIFWAAVIAVLFHPLYRWIDKYLKHPSLSSIISVISVIIVLFLPLILISTLLVNESVNLYQRISAGDYVQKVDAVTLQLDSELLSPVVDKIRTEWSTQAANIAKNISVFIFENVKSITQNSIRFTFMFFIMLYTLYYFFKDGTRMLKRLMHLSPLGEKYEEMLSERFTSMTRATLKGTFIIGGIQGLLGWITFAITGVEAAFVWAVIMTVIAIIPAVGSFLVWFPVGCIMLLTGNLWEGVTILLVGAVIISNIDNLLRPALIQKETQMHPILVLFSTLGGIVLFGMSGFIIGPIIMALFLAVMNMYDHYYKTPLQRN